MTRKSKQAGGNMPLTSVEMKKYSVGYGTTTARLNAISQYTFGDCALSLHLADDHPVATPSGYIYEKAAILEYLLTKTQQLKKEKREYEAWLRKCQTEENEKDERKRKAQVVAFEEGQKVVTEKKQRVDDNPLKRTSYWLAEFQPEAAIASNSFNIPPKRPPSPNSQQPLCNKDLIALNLIRDTGTHVICAVSERPITTQPAIALVTKKGALAEVVLEQVFNDLGKEKLCPVTGRKISKILQLRKGGSSFAASGGSIEAKTYRPSMT
ncbi:unnamed protein product [Cylindrotheca closterium]|uniref:Nitric oxide synthase-interacting protein zinc-finger domain-containing protein n=1 Tax=Cylindrotheca closterium TaxID=2856 RepID=A0AAD2G8H3_9STRA|nr:unnamed protein product [Cylindrotheca closterium]